MLNNVTEYQTTYFSKTPSLNRNQLFKYLNIMISITKSLYDS